MCPEEVGDLVKATSHSQVGWTPVLLSPGPGLPSARLLVRVFPLSSQPLPAKNAALVALRSALCPAASDLLAPRVHAHILRERRANGGPLVLRTRFHCLSPGSGPAGAADLKGLMCVEAVWPGRGGLRQELNSVGTQDDPQSYQVVDQRGDRATPRPLGVNRGQGGSVTSLVWKLTLFLGFR